MDFRYLVVKETFSLSFYDIITEKSRIRETPTLSTDADNRTDTNLKRLHDLSLKKKINK